MIDSRKCTSESLFIAYKGTGIDSHNYIASAVQNGAKYIVLDDPSFLGQHEVKYILVKDARKSISLIAANYYDHPSEEMTLVGVTGTNGKTTTSNLLYNLFFRLGYKCGLVSTIEILYNQKVIPSELTTPDAISLQRIFREMCSEGVTHVFMEVSSHALDQGRVDDVKFDLAVFTNISHDHLDYHKTFKEYIHIKKLLFDRMPKGTSVLTNIDDTNGKVMVQNCNADVYGYALKKPTDFKGKIISNEMSGLQMMIDEQEVYLKMVGEFNGYNAMAVYGSAVLLGLEKQTILQALSALVTAEGRLDIVRKEDVNYHAVVDYAHTPDALEKILKTLVDVKNKNARLLTVVGCGGDRDKAKRPKMARIGSLYSDVLILTSDNPRTEDPDDILNDMLAGLEKDQMKDVMKVTERSEAIKLACLLATSGDLILIAGKGHEKYQDIKGNKIPFDDKEVVLTYMS